MDLLYYLFMVLAFVAVVLLSEGAYFLWANSQGKEVIRIATRLQAVSEMRGSVESANLSNQRRMSESLAMHAALVGIPIVKSLDRLLIQSGMKINVATYIGYTFVSFLCGIVIALILNIGGIIALLCGIGSGFIPFLIIKRTKKKRLQKIEEGLPDAIDMISRALKAGHAFSAAMEMVATEGVEPIAGEFRTTFNEVNYGISMQEALMNLSNRVPSTDLRYLVVAIVIQRESGGNLAELLEKISSLIRERLKLLGTIQVLSAEGRLSGWILGGLPFVMAIVLYFINTAYMSILFTDPMGLNMLYGALGMMAIGIYLMIKIIKIRV